ncbi:hypothetical protein SKAU_G00285020 [Synaphobranchus kaupii]|uniref:FIP-RBD domain-containing protein n=1 Tax=Synaphobranchus kaupii TaxID=118154 RepID=A0A9Q1EXV2_SYNKA|nr:hypothetical protein SKAU_G00285020 [Synaphobranchus kaupii]
MGPLYGTAALHSYESNEVMTRPLLPSQATDSMGSGGGPYSQLTHPELVSLVIKQQGQLSEKDSKIRELEVYIDNLLVRIIEEQPSILLSMSMAKKAV